MNPYGTPINVLQVLEDFSEIAGGIPRVVNDLIKYVSNDNIHMNVLYAKGSSLDPRALASPPSFLGRPWSWNSHLKKDIHSLLTLGSYSKLIHIHGVWSAPQLLSGQIATELNLPFIISSHGMLEPWLWTKQGMRVKLKKLLYWNLLASRYLCHAKVVHAITPLERDHLYKLFPKNRIEVIPNAIHLDQDTGLAGNISQQREKIILFMGRVEPKKGVHLLIQAFAMSRISRDWKLVILGPSWSSEYMRYLIKMVNENALNEQVIFKGPIFGDEKRDWMLKSWVLVAPSYSEAIGIVNLEAAVDRLPSITTYETGLFNWGEGGGILISPNVEEVKKAIQTACSWSISERDHRGESSRSLVVKKYSWSVVSSLWTQLYNEV